MTLEDLLEVARKALPEGARFSVTYYIDQGGYSTASAHVHRRGRNGIERSIYGAGRGASALEQAALAIVESRWRWEPVGEVCAVAGCESRPAPGDAHCELHTAELPPPVTP